MPARRGVICEITISNVILVFRVVWQVKLQVPSLLNPGYVDTGLFILWQFILFCDICIEVLVLILELLLEIKFVEVVVHLEEEHDDEAEQNHIEQGKLQEVKGHNNKEQFERQSDSF